jgi:predicted transcriptional regulator
MMHRLRKEDLVTLQVLSARGQSNRAVAALLGVTEGAVRYRRKTAGRQTRQPKDVLPMTRPG